MKRWIVVCKTFVSLALFAAIPGGALAAEPSAQAILDSIVISSTLSGSGQASIELTVLSKQGQKKVQQLDIFRNDDKRGTVQQLVVFTAPADVKGTKFLSLSAPNKETQMYLYLPALGRERLISGSAAKGSFMGTDFSFEEISGDSSYSADYVPKRLADTTIDGASCYVLELTPKNDDIDYGRLKMVVHKQARLPVLVEFYNRAQKMTKTLTLSDLHQNKKGDWQPSTITLKNITTGGSTIIRILKESDAPLSSEVFTLRYLRR